MDPAGAGSVRLVPFDVLDESMLALVADERLEEAAMATVCVEPELGDADADCGVRSSLGPSARLTPIRPGACTVEVDPDHGVTGTPAGARPGSTSASGVCGAMARFDCAETDVPDAE